MKLLFLSHRVPYPPTKGEKIRAFEELRFLGARHEVHLLALAGPEERGPRPELEEHCRRVELYPRGALGSRLRAALAVFGRAPLTHAYFHSPALAARVRELVAGEAFDAVLAYTAAMAPYALAAQGPRRVLDLVDVDSAKWAALAAATAPPRSLVHRLEARRMRAFEGSLAANFDLVLVTTERERRLLESIADAPVRVVRVGAPAPPAENAAPRSPTPGLVFTGQMDYLPNVDGITRFARGAFPRLRAEFPGLELYVVGRAPARRVRSLARIPGVVVTGSVPEVAPYLARAWAFVAPLRISQGVQMKVLEAMAAGLPVAATGEVAGGLADGGVEPGRDLLVGDGAAFEGAVRSLLESAELRARIGDAGRRRVAESYRWEASLAALDEGLEALVGGAVAAPAPLATAASREAGLA